MRVHFNSSSHGAEKSIQKNRDARLCRFKCFLTPWWMCPLAALVFPGLPKQQAG